MTKMNSKAIGLLSETASDLAYFALPVKVATDLITIKGFVEADKVLNDETLLNMMAEAGWIIESKNDAGEKIYFADPRKKLTEKEQEEYFDELVRRVELGYSFFETEQAEFFRPHSTFNKTYTIASDYQIYQEVRNLPKSERQKKLQEYIRRYEGKLLGAIYAENDSNELTAEQRAYIERMLYEYEQHLNTLDERYKEAFYAFQKYVCG